MDFFTFKNIICLTVILITGICTFLPDHILYTASCKRSWIIVLTILSSCSFIANKNLLGTFIFFVLLVGLFIHFLAVYFKKLEGCDL